MACTHHHGAAVTVADPGVKPDALALTTIASAVPIDRTMASALPLKALRLVPLYDVVSVGSPLSTPTNWPGPETENVSDVLAVGTKAPLATLPPFVQSARRVPEAQGTVHLPAPGLRTELSLTA